MSRRWIESLAWLPSSSKTHIKLTKHGQTPLNPVQSTGKDAAWLAQRSTLEIFALLDAALQVNLSDGLLELGKKVGGRLGRVFAAKTNTTPASAIS